MEFSLRPWKSDSRWCNWHNRVECVRNLQLQGACNISSRSAKLISWLFHCLINENLHGLLPSNRQREEIIIVIPKSQTTDMFLVCIVLTWVLGNPKAVNFGHAYVFFKLYCCGIYIWQFVLFSAIMQIWKKKSCLKYFFIKIDCNKMNNSYLTFLIIQMVRSTTKININLC